MSFQLRPGIARLFRLPLRGRHSIHADIDEELEALIASRVEDLVARGVPPDTARSEALRRLGASLESVRDVLHHSAEVRERRMRVRDYGEDFIQDVRYAARGLVRRPAFTAVAVATLAATRAATDELDIEAAAHAMTPRMTSSICAIRRDFAGVIIVVSRLPRRF